MPEQMILKSRRKWFWVGIILSFFMAPFPGLIYGIALFREPEYKKEATIIIIWSIAWTLITYLLLKWLQTTGYAPYFKPYYR